MLSKSHKLSFMVSIQSIELLELYSQPCYFELIFNTISQISPHIPSTSPGNPISISISTQFSFEIPLNHPADSPLIIQIKLREAFSKKKLAFNELDLRLLQLPYTEWIPLSNKSGLQARILISMIYSASIPAYPIAEEEKNPSNSAEKPLNFGRGTSWIETKPKEFRLDYYRKKLFFFGDDQNPVILTFDFMSECFETMPTPNNLQLMGYSAACGLPNGKIVISGGINHNLNIIVPTVFAYDPIRNKAEVLGSMLQARYTHCLVYKDHYIYALGGRYYGKGNSGVLEKCEKYDLNTNKWAMIANMLVRRCTAQAFIHNNQIFMVAGYEGTYRLSSVEKYDEVHDKWEILPFKLPFSIEAGMGIMISPEEGVYIGGQTDQAKSDGILLLNFKEISCKEIGYIKKGRILGHAAIFQEKIYVFGGSGNDYDWERVDTNQWISQIMGNYQTSVENTMKNFASCVTYDYLQEEFPAISDEFLIFGVNERIFSYNLSKNSIKPRNMPLNMKLFQGNAYCLMPNGYIMVAGGKDLRGFASKKTFLFNPVNFTSLIGASMFTGKWSHSLLHYKGFVYSIGGITKGNKIVNSCERYSVKANKWEEIEFLIENRACPTLYCWDNALFCFSGFRENDLPVNSIEKYDIQEDSWKLLEIVIPNNYLEKPMSFQNEENIYLFSNASNKFVMFNVKETIVKIEESPFVSQNKLTSDSSFIVLSKELDLIALTNEENNSKFTIFTTKFPESKPENSNLSHNIDPKTVITPLKMLPTLRNPNIFSYFDEISLYQDIERESKLLIFSSSSSEKHHILEFNMKTEAFELFSLNSMPASFSFFKHARAIGLPDGKVLLTGGLYTSELGVSVVNSVYIYNHFNRSIKEASPMNVCRFQHTIVATSRFVYCLGGKKFYSSEHKKVLNSCERYNIREKTWQDVPPLIEAVYNAGACILDNDLYVFGGNTGQNLTSTIQVLNKIKLTWRKLDVVLPKPIESISVLPFNYHQILLCGGFIHDCSVNDVLLLDIAKGNCFKSLPSMLHNRKQPKISIFGKNLYVFGGNSVFSCEKAWVSTPEKLKWETMSSYSHFLADDLNSMSWGISRMDLDSMKIDHFSESIEGKKLNSSISFDKLYIFGTELFPFILKLRLPTLKWEKIAKPEGLHLWDYSVAITLPNGQIILTGGINNSLSSIKNMAFLLTVTEEGFTVEEQTPLIQARYTHTMCYLNNYVYVMGGRYFGAGVAGVLSKCERFNLVSKEWQEISNLNMKSCTAVAIAYLNKVYLFGGYRGDGRNKHIERYNELTNLWENVPLLLKHPIEAEVLLPLSNHEFVLLGGKDDFTEQKYVMVYDLERGTITQEKDLKSPRILCKAAKYNGIIYVIGGNADMSCEMAKVGEWEWKMFEGYEGVLETALDKPSLAKSAYAQSL